MARLHLDVVEGAPAMSFIREDGAMDGEVGRVRTRDGEVLPVVARGIENGQPDAVVIGPYVFDLKDGEHDLLDVLRACAERGWVPVRTSDP